MQTKKEMWNTYYQNTPYEDELQKDDPLLQTLLHTKTPITSVLDIGCGYGDLLRLFAQKNIKSTGIDIASIPLEKTQEKLTKKEKNLITFINADFHTLDLKKYDFKHRFDLVTTFMGPSLRHEKDYQNFINASKKYCRIGVFVEGANTLLQTLQEKNIMTLPQEKNSERDAIYRHLQKTPYNYQSQKVNCQKTWREKIDFWHTYIQNISQTKIYPQKLAVELQQHAHEGYIKATTTITYEILTIEITP